MGSRTGWSEYGRRLTEKVQRSGIIRLPFCQVYRSTQTDDGRFYSLPGPLEAGPDPLPGSSVEMDVADGVHEQTAVTVGDLVLFTLGRIGLMPPRNESI